jgi:YVTN family beta-propeller protein
MTNGFLSLAVSPDQHFLMVANAGSDTLSALDARTDRVVEIVWARENPADPFGAQPNALACDHSGHRLFVCNGSQNAVAVFDFKPGATRRRRELEARSSSPPLACLPLEWCAASGGHW